MWICVCSLPNPLSDPQGICLLSLHGVGGFQYKGKFLSGIYERLIMYGKIRKIQTVPVFFFFDHYLNY